jgi:hypothetical protein
MSSPQSTNPRLGALTESVRRAVQNDPRKAGILGALLLILAFMVTRLAWSASSGPSVAHATHAGLRLGPSEAPWAVPGPRAEGRGRTADSGTPLTRWLESASPTTLSRNPFAIAFERFPPDPTASAPETGGRRSFWDDLAKSMSDDADQQERKQEKLLSLQAQARDLRVSSVMMGPTPRAVVNDTLVGEGDVVAGFRVLRIEARRIVVEREQVRLELQMK